MPQMTLKEQRAREEQAARVWRAQCDGAEDPKLDFEWHGGFVEVSGALWDGRRSKYVSVGFDKKGAYAFEGTRRYRVVECGTRKDGMLVLEGGM